MEASKKGSKPPFRFNRITTAASKRELELQRIVTKASNAAKASIAFISIVGSDRQKLVASVGLSSEEYPQLDLICKRVILQLGEPLVVLDTHKEQFCSKLSALSAPPIIRFYLGIPLVDRTGYALGTLCIADTINRQEAPDLTTLKHLAREAERIMAN